MQDRQMNHRMLKLEETTAMSLAPPSPPNTHTQFRTRRPRTAHPGQWFCKLPYKSLLGIESHPPSSLLPCSLLSPAPHML